MTFKILKLKVPCFNMKSCVISRLSFKKTKIHEPLTLLCFLLVKYVNYARIFSHKIDIQILISLNQVLPLNCQVHSLYLVLFNINIKFIITYYSFKIYFGNEKKYSK